jgi:hypothetical protein
MKHTITLTRDKETKNKIRFSNEATEAISGSLYIAKELVGEVNAIQFSFELPTVVTAPTPVAA